MNVVDDKGAKAAIKIVGSGTSVTLAKTGNSLDGNVRQTVDSIGVSNIATDTFGKGIVSANLVDLTGASYHLSNFQSTSVELAGATNGSLTVDGAAGGAIKLDSGTYAAAIAVKPLVGGTAAQNRLTVALGKTSGSLLIDDSSLNGVAPNIITGGSGTEKMTFIGVKSTMLTGGSGSATVFAMSGTNSFTAGPGLLDVTGGKGANAYIFHASSGLLKSRTSRLRRATA